MKTSIQAPTQGSVEAHAAGPTVSAHASGAPPAAVRPGALPTSVAALRAADVLRLQRTLGNRAVTKMLAQPAPIQRRELGAGRAISSDVIRHAALEGVATPATALPHAEQIQRSFGRHAVQGVEAHRGERASQSAAAMGALAYTMGQHVVFAGAPSLRTAAHEVAHVVQQRGGVQIAGGVGGAGDAYERHADAVADRVVAGQSAERLLDRFAGSPSGSFDAGALPARPVQRTLDGLQLQLQGHRDRLAQEGLAAEVLDAEFAAAGARLAAAHAHGGDVAGQGVVANFEGRVRAAVQARVAAAHEQAAQVSLHRQQFLALHPDEEDLALAAWGASGDSTAAATRLFDDVFVPLGMPRVALANRIAAEVSEARQASYAGWVVDNSLAAADLTWALDGAPGNAALLHEMVGFARDAAKRLLMPTLLAIGTNGGTRAEWFTWAKKMLEALSVARTIAFYGNLRADAVDYADIRGVPADVAANVLGNIGLAGDARLRTYVRLAMDAPNNKLVNAANQAGGHRDALQGREDAGRITTAEKRQILTLMGYPKFRIAKRTDLVNACYARHQSPARLDVLYYVDLFRLHTGPRADNQNDYQAANPVVTRTYHIASVPAVTIELTRGRVAHIVNRHLLNFFDFNAIGNANTFFPRVTTEQGVLDLINAGLQAHPAAAFAAMVNGDFVQFNHGGNVQIGVEMRNNQRYLTQCHLFNSEINLNQANLQTVASYLNV